MMTIILCYSSKNVLYVIDRTELENNCNECNDVGLVNENKDIHPEFSSNSPAYSPALQSI